MLKVKHAFTFEYSALEKVVKQLYGKEIRILDLIPDERIGHYTYHEFTVNGESELEDIGDEKIVQKWIETGEMSLLDVTDIPELAWLDYGRVDVRHILHRLFNEGHIPAGNYIMLVDW